MDGISSTLQSLVSALGGRDPTVDGNPYILGDDGLGCLRDIKRWLQHYDEKKDVWDVKSALASINVVSTDLCPILESWSPQDEENEHRRRICLACVEILVPMTWPMDLGQDADEFKIKQYPNLKLAQSGYKRAILFNPEQDVLSTILRVAYPSLAKSRRERSERDHGVIRLVVYLLRNLTAIDEGSNRSETILAFQKAKALEFLCVLASGMGEDFLEEDVIVLDTMYFLLRGVDSVQLFQPFGAISNTVKKDLSDLLAKEKHMRSDNRKQAHTRHTRFGTMISVVKGSRRFTVASQTAIVGNNFAGIEATKRWNKPQQHIKTHEDVDTKISLNTEARIAANTFVGMFLDAGFNPLFTSVLKALEHDNSRVSQTNRLQFLYLQGWCFRALREKGKKSQKLEKLGSDFSDDADYQLIASMMDSRATIMLRKMLREGIESKLWKESHAAMDCLKELLLTIHSMSMSSDVEYQEIAENLQSNLYYEESNLDLVASCVRTYSNQSLGYLNACTDLATVLLKMLEKFASTKTHMFVRARRQRQRKRTQKTANATTTAPESDEEATEAGAREAVKEREFNFAKFERKFTNDHSIDTFVTFLEFYADLEADQIKRVIQFFHRIFVKQKNEILLYRLDLFELLNRILKDTLNLPATNQARTEIENFTIYFFKRFSRSIETSPALVWEILFEKLSNDPYYLDHDSNKAPAVKKVPRAPAEFEIRPGLDLEERIKVAVAVLLDNNKSAFLDWFKSVLADIVTRRYSWEAQHQAAEGLDGEKSFSSLAPAETLLAQDDDMKILLYRDGKVRLLLKVVGLERLGDKEDVDALWILPSTNLADDLNNALQLIKKYTSDPPEFEEGKFAKDFIRRQALPKNTYHSESSSESSTGSEHDNSHVEGRTKKKSLPKKIRRRAIIEVDYDVIEARRLKREQMEEQRKGSIKSSKYVNDSDDGDNEAADAIFFAAEAALRKRQRLKAAASTQHTENIQPISRKRLTAGKSERRPEPAQGSSDKENRSSKNLFVPSEEDSDAASPDNSAGRHASPESSNDGSPEASGVKRHHSKVYMNRGNALFTRDSSDSEMELIDAKRVKTSAKRSARQLIHSDDSD